VPRPKGGASLADGVERAALIAVALLAAAALVAPSARGRACTMLVALAGCPVLLLADVWNGASFAPYRDRPAVLGAGAVLGIVAVTVGALVLARRPGLVAVGAVVAMPFRLPIAIGGATANLLLPLYVVIGSAALAHAAPRLRRRPEARPPGEYAPGAIDWLLAATLLLYSVQATYSSDFSQALQHLLFFYVPFAVLFAVLVRLDWTPRLLRHCLVAFVALGLLFCVVGFAEEAAGAVLWNDKLIQGNAYNPYFRVNSLFYDPNILGRFLVIVMALVATVVGWSARRRDVRAGVVVLLVLWAGLLITLSQSSLGALLVALAVLFALAGYGRVVGLAIAALLVATVAVVIAAPGALHLRSGGDRALRKATSGRTDLVRGGADLYAERPLLGFGAGSFEREYRRLRGLSSAQDVTASHTTPLTIAAEQGVPGLALYLALLAVAFTVLGRRARDAIPRAAVVAAFAALVAHTLVYASFLEDPLVWALLAAGAGLAARPSPAPVAGRRAEVAAPAPPGARVTAAESA
jgi:O-antigen ligase